MDLWEWGSLDEVEWLIDSRNEAHHTANLWDWGSLDEVGWQILDPIVPLDRFERFQDLPIELQYEVYRHHFSTFLVFVSCCAPRECGNLGIHRHLRHLNTQFPDMSITKVSKQIHQDSMICFRRYALFGIFFLHRFVHDDNRCMLEPSELARKRERFEDDVKTFRHVLGPRYSCWVEGEYSNTFEFAHADSGLEFHSLQTIRAEHTIFRRPIGKLISTSLWRSKAGIRQKRLIRTDLTFDRYQIKELAKVVNGGIISIDLAIEIPIFVSCFYCLHFYSSS